MARHRDTSYLKNWKCAGFAHGGNHRIASETKQAKSDYSMGGLGFRCQASGLRCQEVRKLIADCAWLVASRCRVILEYSHPKPRKEREVRVSTVQRPFQKAATARIFP